MNYRTLFALLSFFIFSAHGMELKKLKQEYSEEERYKAWETFCQELDPKTSTEKTTDEFQEFTEEDDLRESLQSPIGLLSMHAPWREAYMEQMRKKEVQQQTPTQNECLLCNRMKRDYIFDDNTSVLIRNDNPYRYEQLLIILKKHAATLQSFDQEEQYKIMESLCKTVKQLFDQGAQGVNILINEGDPCSGASIPGHLHIHIIPSCKGDSSNFSWHAAAKLIEYERNSNNKPLNAPFRLYRQLLEKFSDKPCNFEHGSRACTLCTIVKDNPAKNSKYSIFKRTKHLIAILNKFGSGNAHILIAPVCHSSSICELDNETQKQLMNTLSSCRKFLAQELKTHGFNYSIHNGSYTNSIAPEHTYAEIIGRWNSDCASVNISRGFTIIGRNHKNLYEMLEKHFEKSAE